MKALFTSTLLALGSITSAQTDTLKNQRFSLHAQATAINQFKPGFSASYSGDHSLITQSENKTSVTSTYYLGLKLWKGACLFLNPEIAGGSGLSQALGIAAATNGETFRIGSPAPKLYIARLFYRQVIALTKNKSYQASDFNQIGGYLPDKYIAVTIGKIGVADYFDNNTYSHNPRTQFMSWALMDNGAWDYPANTRGYTPSLVIEYISHQHEIRYGISLVPLVANGNKMNTNVAEANSQTIEYTHYHKIKNREGAVRLLGFFTTANMGNYQQSIDQDPTHPVIENTREYGHTKYGFGINLEQHISKNVGLFSRASWNDGTNETWTFTEIDRSVSAGLVVNGEDYKRPNDNIGIASEVSGISKPHGNYLKAGGKGFMLGDGKLNYGLEHLTELFYSAALYKTNIYLTGAYQLVTNPGYNKDRHGPVNVFSARLHARI